MNIHCGSCLFPARIARTWLSFFREGKYSGGALLDGADAIAVDLGGDGPLQQIHGYNDTQLSLFGAHDEAFHPRQRSAINAYTLSGTEVGPGDEQGLSVHQSLQVVNLTLADGHRGGADAENLLDARRLQNANAVAQEKAAKQVTGKDRLIDYFDAVGPLVSDMAQGHPGLNPALGQFGACAHFPPGRRSDGKPARHI